MNTVISTPSNFQDSSLEVNETSEKSCTNLILQHPDGSLLNVDKLFHIMSRLKKLTLPYFNVNGDALQIWKIHPDILVGTILDKWHARSLIKSSKYRL